MRKTLLLGLTLAPFIANADLTSYDEDQICTSIAINDPWVEPIVGSSNNLIKTQSQSYLLKGSALKIKARQNHYVYWDGGYPQYKTTRKFQFYSAGEYASPILKRDFKSSENYNMTFSSKGRQRAVVVAKDSEIMLPGQGPFGDDVYLPLCDVIEVNVQNAPSLENNQSTVSASYQKITLKSIKHIVDTLSKAALEPSTNATIKLTAVFEGYATSKTYTLSDLTSTNDYTVDTRYKGTHSISATINDGTFSKSSYWGSIFVNGVDRDVPPCPGCDIE